MKGTYGLLVIGLLFSVQTKAGGEKNNIPKKIVSGDDTLKKTERERFKEVARQIENLNQEAVNNVLGHAINAELQAMAQILPPWCMLVPPSILVHVSFQVDDTDLERGLKFIRLAFLVRDMYQDIPLNIDTLLTYQTPYHLRISDHLRYKLVAGSFLQAYKTMSVLAERENIDMILSLANIATWSLHYLEAANEESSVDGFNAAAEAYRYAIWASNAGHLAPDQLDYLRRLKNLSLGAMSKTLAPIFGVLLMSLGQNSNRHR